MKRASVCFGLTAAIALAAPAFAQDRVLMPEVRYFGGPVADPVEPRLAIGLIFTDILSTQGPERTVFTRPADPREVQAGAAIGGTIPILRIATWNGGGLLIGAQAGVFARFRIEQPSRDDFGQDWIVAMPIEMKWDEVSARLRISHRSSHLGDEFSESSGARRIEFGGESIDGLVAVELRPGVRVYAGGGWIFHSNTDNTDVLLREDRADRFMAQLGADAEFRPWRDPHVSLVAGVDWQSAERTDWEAATALAGGIRLRSGARGLRLVARYLDGVSPLGQFFLTPEQYTSLELVIEF